MAWSGIFSTIQPGNDWTFADVSCASDAQFLRLQYSSLPGGFCRILVAQCLVTAPRSLLNVRMLYPSTHGDVFPLESWPMDNGQCLIAAQLVSPLVQMNLQLHLSRWV